ncbi:MAG TPA: hypothetical protein VF411_07430 [Bacteroidia bacterium]
MKRFLLLMVSFISLATLGQTIPNSFKIINNQHPESEAFYIASITKASMENYRLKDKEVTLKFDNGFNCVMLSAKDLFRSGKSINASNYQESFPINFSLPVFNILQDGHLMAKYPNVGKTSKK